MVMEGKDIVAYLRKRVIVFVKTPCKFACNHPFVLGMLVFALLLYRSCPSLFAFLVSSSPVVVCTALLLGILLSYGEPSIPQIELEHSIESHVESGREIEAKAVEEVASSEGRANAGSHSDRHFPSTSMHIDDDNDAEEEEEEKESYTAVRSLIKEDEKESHTEEKVTEGPKAEVDRLTSENVFDSSLVLPWQPIDRQDDSSDSESDHAESSSSDASIGDIIPMLNELHPLVHSENKKDGEDEDCNAKDNGAQVAVMWTADDQKNLMDLGTSELERNQRLESLIAKRRALQNRRFEARRNLIDLDSSDTAPIMEHLSHLLVQIPRISASRRNPFDLSYDYSEENTGLPPIPGSAPSVLQPRWNPFDFPYDQVDESDRLKGEGSSHQEFVEASRRDTLFRTHESFTMEPSFSGQFKQERHGSKLNPNFIPERMDSDKADFVRHQSQSSGMSDLNVSSIHESDSISSVTDEEDREGFIEEELYPEAKQLNHAHHVNEPFDFGNQLEGDAMEGAHLSTNAFRAVEEDVEFNLPISEGAKLDEIDDTPFVSPIYDSSPSAIEKSVSNIVTLDEVLLCTGKEDLNLGSYLTSGMLAGTSELGSLSRPVEKKTISEDEDFVSVLGGTWEDLMSDNQGLCVASSNLCSVDENESRSREVSEVREEDVIVSGFFRFRGDPIAPLIPSPTSSQLMQHLSPTDVAEDLQTKADKTVATTKCCPDMLLFDESPSAASEKEHESILDLPPIPEEKADDFKFEEEHEIVINPTTNSTLNSLQMIEDHYVCMYDTEQSSLQGEFVEETYDVDNITRLVLEAKSSVTSQMVSLQDHSSMGILSLSEIKYGLEDKGEGHLIGMKSHIINEVQNQNDGGFLDKPSDSEEESEKIYAEVKKIEDERLLLELDAVGDFHVDELKSSQIGIDRDLWPDDHSDKIKASSSISSTMEDIFSLVQISQVGSMEGISTSLKSSPKVFSNNLNEMKSRMDQMATTEGEFGSLSLPYGEDPELTVYNSKLRVLDACSLEEIESIYKLLSQETLVTSILESSLDKSITAGLPETDLEIPVTEAKSVGDMNYAFKQFGEDSLDIYLLPEVGHAEISPSRMHVEVMGDPSGLPVIEAKSMQLSDSTSVKPPRPAELYDGSTEVEANERHLQTEILEVLNVREADSELLATKANSKGDVGLAFQECPEGGFDESALCEVGESEIFHVESVRTLSDFRVVQATSVQDIDFAYKQFSERNTESLAVSVECKYECTEVEGSKRHLEHDAFDGSQLTEIDSKVLILEAKSIEDIELAFKRVVVKGSLEDIHLALEVVSESTTDNLPKPAESDVRVEDLGSEVSVDVDLIETDSELVVLEEKSIGDISLAFKHVADEVLNTSLHSEVKQSESLESIVPVEPLETQSDMQFVEAKSLEYICTGLRLTKP